MKADQTEENKEAVSYLEILKLNRKEWHIMILGGILALGCGAIQPFFALLFADVLDLYAKYNCAITSKHTTNGTFTSDFFNQTFNASHIKLTNDECRVDEFNSDIAFFALMFCLLG